MRQNNNMAPSGGIGAELQKFIVTGTEPLTSLNKLALRGALTKYGSIKTISCYKEGFLICFNEVTDKGGLLSLRSVCDKQISISCDNVSKGTVFCSDFMDCTDDEITAELPEGVSLLRRLPSRGSQSVEKSGRLLLEFPTASSPSHLLLNCNLRLEVRSHIPAPLRCRTCLEFGHHERVCGEKVARCGFCSQKGHSLADCTAKDPQCYACGMQHEISSSECMVWRTEMSVNTVRFRQGVSKAKARRIVNNPQAPRPSGSVPTPDLSYNSAELSAAQPSSFQTATYAKITQNRATPFTTSATMEEPSTHQSLESLIIRQMALLQTLVNQNATIIEQNNKLINRISAPKLKQPAITSALTRTSSLGTLSASQNNKRSADESPPEELQSKKQHKTQPALKQDQRS